MSASTFTRRLLLGKSLASPAQRDADRVPVKSCRLHVYAKSKTGDAPEPKESLFTSITNALDFSAVRSDKDAQLLRDASAATRMGEKMSREQYGALRRKVGGTAKSFFKEYIDVDGDFVEEGWVDKTCKYCKKDASSGPRSKDVSGRYFHLACAENSKSKGNFFSKLFS